MIFAIGNLMGIVVIALNLQYRYILAKAIFFMPGASPVSIFFSPLSFSTYLVTS